MVLITGCNMNQAYEWFYYDRAKYIIALESDNTEVTYLCVKESAEEKTEKKVNKANSHFSAKYDALVKEYAEGMLERLEKSSNEDDKAGFLMGEVQVNFQLQKQMEKIMSDVEKLYQCKIIGLESD